MSRARSTKAAKARRVPVQRPTFEPCWTEAEAVRMADDHLAPDNVAQAAFRIAMVILARTPEELMEGALKSPREGEEEGPAECVARILHEVEEALKGRLQIIKSAQARVLMTACFVHGVELPRG